MLSYADRDRGAWSEGDYGMTTAEYAVLSILIAVVGVSLWLGFLGRQS